MVFFVEKDYAFDVQYKFLFLTNLFQSLLALKAEFKSVTGKDYKPAGAAPAPKKKKEEKKKPAQKPKKEAAQSGQGDDGKSDKKQTR